MQKFLEARDEKGLLEYMNFIGCNGRQVFRIDQVDPKNPSSGMKPARVMNLPASLFDNERARSKSRLPADVAFGMGMSYNGFVVINTGGGKVVTLDRETLEVSDVFTTPGKDELFLNSFATGPEANGGAGVVFLHSAPMFHMAALSSIMSYTSAGATHVILPRFDPAAVVKAISTEKVNMALLVPTMIDFVDRHLPGAAGRHELAAQADLRRIAGLRGAAAARHEEPAEREERRIA